MRTPLGVHCPHYYEDFQRDRNLQECRLINHQYAGGAWQVKDCFNCSVPKILQANGSLYLILEAKISRGGFLWFKRKVCVTAYCAKHKLKIEDAYIGCTNCASEFRESLQILDL